MLIMEVMENHVKVIRGRLSVDLVDKDWLGSVLVHNWKVTKEPWTKGSV